MKINDLLHDVRRAALALSIAAFAPGCYGAEDAAGDDLDDDLLRNAGELGDAEVGIRQFFANSRRRDATAAESALIVNVNGCAAFFVDNTQGKTYLASARHCFSGAITTWCNGGGRLRDNAGRTGTCKRIVAADRTHDIAIFEAQFPYVPAKGTVLKLASYAPPAQTRLKMIGYPADRDPQTARRGRLTVTDGCWILQSSIASPYPDLRDRSSLHNCTTYGGNSGGPMYVEGALDAVGLPFTYEPGDYTRRSATNLGTAAHMAQMADLVSVFRRELTAAGIVISDAPP